MLVGISELPPTFTLNVQVAASSKTIVPNYQNTRCHNLQSTVHILRRKCKRQAKTCWVISDVDLGFMLSFMYRLFNEDLSIVDCAASSERPVRK